TEERRGEALAVRRGRERFAREDGDDVLNRVGRRVRIGNEVALQAARLTTGVAAFVARGRRIVVVCRNGRVRRERRGLVMMGQRNEERVQRQAQKNERRQSRAPFGSCGEVAALLQRLISS